jgi:hypothetical protein
MTERHTFETVGSGAPRADKPGGSRRRPGLFSWEGRSGDGQAVERPDSEDVGDTADLQIVVYDEVPLPLRSTARRGG